MKMTGRAAALSFSIVALVGVGALLLPPDIAAGITGSRWYEISRALTLALVFVTMGLGVDIAQARRFLPLVVAVVFVGVPAKFGLTMLILHLLGITLSPEIIMTVVQVEATSALLISMNSRMSLAARTSMALIAMWDDPVTAAAVEIMQGGGSGKVLGAMAPYLVLLGAGLVFIVIRWCSREGAVATAQRAEAAVSRLSRETARIPWLTRDVQLSLMLAGVVALAVWQGWFTLAALAGLVFRPSWVSRGVTRADREALAQDADADVRTWESFTRNVLIAVAFLQMTPYLAGGMRMEGAWLGAAVFISHAVIISVALSLYRLLGGERGREFGAQDILFMAFCQLNGLTAVSLGNGLGAVAAQTVAVALIVVVGLYLATNAILWAVTPGEGGGSTPLRRGLASWKRRQSRIGPPWRMEYHAPGASLVAA